MRIGILTGGGDVPGLNAVIRSATERVASERVELIGIRRGWGGLIYMDPSNSNFDERQAIELNKFDVRKSDREGGSSLHNSRINPLNVSAHLDLEKFRGIRLDKGEKRDLSDDVLKNLGNLGVDALITVGGDDTLSYARHLQYVQGFPVVGIPKTMDGDVMGTDACIGFSTAVNRAKTFIHDLRTCAGSHERIEVLEIFGRHSGFVALYTARAAKPDRVLIPEVEFDIKKVTDLLVGDREENPSRYSVLLVSEGARNIGGKEVYTNDATDQYGHKKLGGIGEVIAGFIERTTGVETIEQRLTSTTTSHRSPIFEAGSL